MTAHPRRAARLEHRLTRPTASLSDLEAAVALVQEHELDALTVNPWLVKPAHRMLGRSRVRLGSVIGYPGGGQLPAVKAFEASRALEHGATQLDFVINAGALLSGEEEAVLRDMLAVVEMAHAALATAGVVLEPAPLSDDRLRLACRLAERAGATHVITAPDGIDVAGSVVRTRILRELLGSAFAIKAVAPFASRDELVAAHAAGASILSTEFTPSLAAEAVAVFALNAVPPLATAV